VSAKQAKTSIAAFRRLPGRCARKFPSIRRSTASTSAPSKPFAVLGHRLSGNDEEAPEDRSARGRRNRTACGRARALAAPLPASRSLGSRSAAEQGRRPTAMAGGAPVSIVPAPGIITEALPSHRRCRSTSLAPGPSSFEPSRVIAAVDEMGPPLRSRQGPHTRRPPRPIGDGPESGAGREGVAGGVAVGASRQAFDSDNRDAAVDCAPVHAFVLTFACRRSQRRSVSGADAERLRRPLPIPNRFFFFLAFAL